MDSHGGIVLEQLKSARLNLDVVPGDWFFWYASTTWIMWNIATSALVGEATAPIRSLSKGNTQKVVLAQALMVWPQLLVLDEPWSGLDASAHSVLAEIIAEVAGAGRHSEPGSVPRRGTQWSR